MTTRKQHEMKYCGCGVTSAPIWTFFTFICGNAHHQSWSSSQCETSGSLAGWDNVCMGKVSSIFEKHGEWRLTSFLRSLLSLCRCHLMTAWGERAWHSRKVLLPSTPYCTISRVFLLAAGHRERGISMATKTLITMNSLQPKSQLWQIKDLFLAIRLLRITIKLPEYSHYSQ